MEIGNNEQQQLVKVKVSELIKKFKHREDRYNFCRQQGKLIYFLIINITLGYWYPNEIGFDSTFFVQFLTKKNIVFAQNALKEKGGSQTRQTFPGAMIYATGAPPQKNQKQAPQEIKKRRLLKAAGQIQIAISRNL